MDLVEAGTPPDLSDLARPLRIVHLVVTDAFAGTERYVANLAGASAHLGHAVHVIGGNRQRMRAALPREVGLVEAGGLAAAVAALRRVPRPDVIHAHLTAAEVAAVIAMPRRGPALVSTRHIAARRGSSPAARAAAVAVRARLDAQIAVSRFVAEAVDGASDVILTGVPDSSTSTDSVRQPTVLVAQRLEAEKDTVTALRAWALSGLAADGWDLTVAGTGAEAARLKEMATRMGLGATARLVGQVDDLAVRMASAAVFIAPAPAEPLGLSVVEAMSHGLPVVAAGSGGHLETVGAVPGAMLFPPGDAAAAAAALRSLVAEPERRRAYGAALQTHQRRHLSLEAFADQVVELYRRALSQARLRLYP